MHFNSASHLANQPPKHPPLEQREKGEKVQEEKIRWDTARWVGDWGKLGKLP